MSNSYLDIIIQAVEFAGLKCEIFDSAETAESFEHHESKKVLQLSIIPEDVNWVAVDSAKKPTGAKSGESSAISAQSIKCLTVEYQTESGCFAKSVGGKEVLEIYAAKVAVLRAVLENSNRTVDVTEFVKLQVGRYVIEILGDLKNAKNTYDSTHSNTVSKLKVDPKLDKLLIKHRLGKYAAALHNLHLLRPEDLLPMENSKLAEALYITQKPIIRRLKRLLQEIKRELGSRDGDSDEKEESSDKVPMSAFDLSSSAKYVFFPRARGVFRLYSPFEFTNLTILACHWKSPKTQRFDSCL